MRGLYACGSQLEYLYSIFGCHKRSLQNELFLVDSRHKNVVKQYEDWRLNALNAVKCDTRGASVHVDVVGDRIE